MSSIRLVDVTKKYDGHLVLREAHLRLARGDKVGLIGKNGAGKTTLLGLILGNEHPDAGTVDVDDGINVGYFSQFSELDGAETVTEILDALFVDVHAIEAELAALERALEQTRDDSALAKLLARQANLLERMDVLGGWTYRNRIDTVLTQLGFSARDRDLPVGQLSGGWRNRAALAQIILLSPDVLLMDEPTNYLDLHGLGWLEQWFQKFRGALIVVSHDRHFLDAVANRIVEIENYHLQEYDGSYTDYVRKKQIRLKTLERQFAYEEELLAYEQQAVADRRDADRHPSKALRRRVADIRKKVTPRPIDKIVTDIYDDLQISNELCRVENISKHYGADVIIQDLSFGIGRGDRIAIVGPNGYGKTTLIDVLAGVTEPDSGRVVWSKGAKFVYYNEILAELDPDDSISHAVNAKPGSLAFTAPRKKINRFLGLLRFSEMDLRQRIGTLSGGERARVALAQCLLSGAGVILLDEPTNHLDITSTQVMERALLHFPGAAVLVSHDRYFIQATSDRVLEFEGGGSVRDVSATSL